MQTSFWQHLATPIIGLSPMDGVTDHPYRHLQKKYGRPAVVYTEFTSVEGVCRGADQLLRDFLFDETQRPIVAQIYGITPDFFRQTAVILCELGFDGIDINMGCPAKNVAHTGAGAALIDTPKLAQEIIAATQQGVRDWQAGQTAQDCPNITESIAKEVARRHALLPTEYQQHDRPVPVSVKTRVGYRQPVVETWIPTLLEMEPAVIAIHGRTLKQQYGGKANWDELGKAVQLRNEFAQKNPDKHAPLILGNGDILTLDQAQAKVDQYSFDGILIGRGSFGNPWVFDSENPEISLQQKFSLALEHSRLFEQTYQPLLGDRYAFFPMRKQLGWYCKGFPFASQVRVELFQTNSAAEVEAILKKYELI